MLKGKCDLCGKEAEILAVHELEGKKMKLCQDCVGKVIAESMRMHAEDMRKQIMKIDTEEMTEELSE
ncbi:MAG: hypothetical protein OEX77_05625 [Candidatus Bathyarchaeota archaeon]|nr:hypothetical protein [Candidatus Bathyarchaeota archaeon]MDH5733523.1 hypothetical protein [Candidatus Bathyarchaeota archaeon]